MRKSICKNCGIVIEKDDEETVYLCKTCQIIFTKNNNQNLCPNCLKEAKIYIKNACPYCYEKLEKTTIQNTDIIGDINESEMVKKSTL